MHYLPPAIFGMFSIAFFIIWVTYSLRQHLIFYSLAFLCIAIGALIQISLIPRDFGLNAVYSAFFYVSGALSFSHGILLRSGRHLSFGFFASFLIVIIGGTSFYFYIQYSMSNRVYIINIGMGLIFLLTAMKARFLLQGNSIDKILFWLILALGIHFIPRTILTAESFSDVNGQNFTDSLFWVILQITISIVGLGVGLAIFVVTFSDIFVELRKESDTDPLTGLANRRLFSNHIKKLQDKKKVIFFAIIDIDHFKLYNDTYGHGQGDTALQAVAKILALATKYNDGMAARIGGEEFGLIFYNQTSEEFSGTLDKIHSDIAVMGIEHRMSPLSKILTISIGAAELKDNEDFEGLFKRADQLLYISKAKGGNQISMSQSPLPEALEPSVVSVVI